MHLHHATDDIRKPAPPPLPARLHDPQQEAAPPRPASACGTHAWPLLVLHAGASAIFAAALLPPAGWPLALACCLVILAMLLRALRPPGAQPGRAASGTALLALDLLVFLLCYALRETDAGWHATAFCLLLAAPYAGITRHLLGGAGLAVVASLAWLGLQDELQAGSAATLMLLNLTGLCAGHGQQRQRRAHVLQHAMLTEQAMRDHLTGCYNRRYLDEHLLGAELARSRRHGLCLTAILCDLDHFKRVNDAHGHAAGDDVLRTFAALLGNATRRGIDSVVRHGGEEFLLILPETDLAGGVRLAERLRAGLVQHIGTTASFGVASVACAPGRQAPGAAALVAAADRLLYQAKHAGRNCVRAAMLDAL
ncbi:GGDEF domain-containing protein [Janthinobacterium sp. FW305-129]|uniref:GGDEF domain-containing protein n=1 Tax=Janthinobacterium sp. FW305-129 TaxID=2775054 RepID=UPI001E407C0A|nr:GGDEF domain-containing protein [Janthinobacterium sp. FW305-129]MCC7600915.1 GGDEF domain-containing protein [Janthinobacterium sp. FW305-129]